MNAEACGSEVRPSEVTLAAGLCDFMRQTVRPGLINLAAGIPADSALPIEGLRVAMSAALAANPHAAWGYHAPEGDAGLRELIAARLRARGADVDAKDLIITTGCSQGLAIMVSLLVRPGDVVACEGPAYYALLELISRAGGLALQVPSRVDTGPELAAVDECLARWRPKCMVVCSSLSNPSGATVPEGARAELVEICRRHKVRLVEDEIYGDLRDDGGGRPLLAFDNGDAVSYVASFSKTVAPGLRIGYAAPGALLEPFVRRKCIEDIHSATVAEAAVREFLAAGRMEPHLAGLRRFYAHRRAMAREAVRRGFPEGTQVSDPPGGFLLWVRLPRRIDLAAALQRALAANVSFCDGRGFYAQEPGESCMRLNCAKASEEDLLRGIGILGGILRETMG
jgi:DNA-binding transcriptional MocR family regulator